VLDPELTERLRAINEQWLDKSARLTATQWYSTIVIADPHVQGELALIALRALVRGEAMRRQARERKPDVQPARPARKQPARPAKKRL
jgi:hypothetical protein